METFWLQFGAVALAHALAVGSPGPDFTLVLRQSLIAGRGPAVASAIGVGCGILVHVTYALLGVGLLLRHEPRLFAALKWVGAGYLAWLGWRALRSRAGNAVDPSAKPSAAEVSSAWRGAWRRGFLTNVLNPKATLFFLALFTVGIDPLTPRWALMIYGLWMAVATMAWFSLVAVIMARPGVRAAYRRGAVWIDRLLGVVFLGFAASLLWV